MIAQTEGRQTTSRPSSSASNPWFDAWRSRARDWGETLRLGDEGVALCEQIEEELSRGDAHVQALLERIRPADE